MKLSRVAVAATFAILTGQAQAYVVARGALENATDVAV